MAYSGTAHAGILCGHVQTLLWQCTQVEYPNMVLEDDTMNRQGLHSRPLRPVEQVGRLLGSMAAAGRSRQRREPYPNDQGIRAVALTVWEKGARALVAGDEDPEAFVLAYQDAYRSYRQ